MTQHLVVTGVDTGVGKTVVSALLAAQLLRAGHSVEYVKPVQTGIGSETDELMDSEFVASSINDWLNDDDCNVSERELFKAHTFFTFPEPAAPSVAAVAANAGPVTIEAVNEQLKKLGDAVDFRLIEGAGGVIVPMNEDDLFSDWLSDWQYPTVLVTTPQLGRLNHTLLSVEALLNRGIPLFAIVINHIETPEEASMLAVQTFRSELERCLSMHISLDLDDISFKGPRVSLLETSKVLLERNSDCQALDKASFLRVFQAEYKNHFKNRDSLSNV